MKNVNINYFAFKFSPNKSATDLISHTFRSYLIQIYSVYKHGTFQLLFKKTFKKEGKHIKNTSLLSNKLVKEKKKEKNVLYSVTIYYLELLCGF